MIHRYRRLLLLVGVFAVVLGSLWLPVAAAAAEPEPVPEPPIVDEANIVYETVLTVRFVDSVTLLPVAGATVHVTAASPLHGDLGGYDGTTDADGVAVLTGLPFEAGNIGPAVTLDVSADLETTFVDEESGCSFVDNWHAERLAISAADREIEVAFTAEEQQGLSSIDCPPTEPVPTGGVGGVVGTPKATLPATDTLADAASASPSIGLLIAAGILVASIGLFFLLPRPQRAPVTVDRRRDRSR